jgi:hypothetical protein
VSQEERDQLVTRLVERQRLWRLLDHHSCRDCARPREPEYAGYPTCYGCGHLRSHYGEHKALIPITYTTSSWPLGSGLRDWKDILGTRPKSATAPWFAAIWSAFLERQIPRLEPRGGFSLVTTIPSQSPTVVAALQAAEARGWWVPEPTIVASADPDFPRQRSREGKDRPVIEGKWRVDPERVHDKDLLVLDDLMTSGGTLFSFAAALRQAGANSVTAVILARNLGRDDGEWILPLLKAEHDAGRAWTPDENKHDILGP